MTSRSMLVLALALCMVTGCGASTGPALTAAKAAGTWEGSWNNTTFGSTGAAKATISVNEAMKKIDFTLDLDGNVFGGVNPPAETFSGTYGDNGYSVSGTSSLFGALTLTVAKDGKISGSATPTRGAVSFTGTAGEQAITLNYTLQDSSQTITGTMSMSKK